MFSREAWRRAAATQPLRSNASADDGPIVLGPHTPNTWIARSFITRAALRSWRAAARTQLLRTNIAADDSAALGTQEAPATFTFPAYLSMWRWQSRFRARTTRAASALGASAPAVPVTAPFIAGTLMPPYLTVYIWRRVS